jgi:adenylosuccinate synthase
LIEESLGDRKIGTTKKGIGPCYGDKIQRKGIRIQDFLSPEKFKSKLQENLNEKNTIIEEIYKGKALNFDEILSEYDTFRELIESLSTDTSLFISNSIKENKNILFEGAQGTLLDIDHGTYPFVTSSNTSAGNASIGSGIGPLNFEKVVGVTKAYISRVGTGPFMTEQSNKIGDYLIEKGAEFGTVTGRRRRCGWLDLVSLKYSARINSLSELFITKLDVLTGLDEVNICVGYKFKDQELTDYPLVEDILEKSTPIYKSFEGWNDDISSITEFNKLPESAQTYINFIEEFTEIPIKYISVGPERKQNIIR